MRLLVGLLTCLSVDGLSQAQSHDPSPAPPAAAQGQQPSPPADQSRTATDAAPPSTSTVSAASSTAPAIAPPGQPATVPSAPPGTAPAPPNPSELTAEEKNLLSHGYKMETRNGENYFCRGETVLGTRFQKKVCATAQQLADIRRRSQDTATQVQRPGSDRPNGPGH